MAIRDILVHVDETPASQNRLAVAVDLARRHEARLVGLYVGAVLDLSPYIASFVGEQIREAHDRAAAEIEARVRESFEKAIGGDGVSGEWRAVSGSAEDAIALHGRYADLVVVGQQDPDVRPGPGFTRIAEEVVCHAGRPVLVVPYAGRFSTVGRRVMIAWDGSAEAARAVHDALPILEKADKVMVRSVDPEDGPGGLGDLPGADIAAHLARHGVTVEVEVLRTREDPAEGETPYESGTIATHVSHLSNTDMPIAETLLSLAADDGTDLIVMGAYSHSPLREALIGGVTRQMLMEMTVPLLMAH